MDAFEVEVEGIVAQCQRHPSARNQEWFFPRRTELADAALSLCHIQFHPEPIALGRIVSIYLVGRGK